MISPSLVSTYNFRRYVNFGEVFFSMVLVSVKVEVSRYIEAFMCVYLLEVILLNLSMHSVCMCVLMFLSEIHMKYKTCFTSSFALRASK